MEPHRCPEGLSVDDPGFSGLGVPSMMMLNLLVASVAMALGAFVAASPRRAAEIWGAQRFERLSPERRPTFVRWYRAFGCLLWLAGTLFAVESIVFSNYHH